MAGSFETRYDNEPPSSGSIHICEGVIYSYLYGLVWNKLCKINKRQSKSPWFHHAVFTVVPLLPPPLLVTNIPLAGCLVFSIVTLNFPLPLDVKVVAVPVAEFVKYTFSSAT